MKWIPLLPLLCRDKETEAQPIRGIVEPGSLAPESGLVVTIYSANISHKANFHAKDCKTTTSSLG